MLKNLYIKDFLLVEEQTIQFSDSFNVILGETGSGKSLIFKALRQLSGEKSTANLIRTNCSFALIEAEFTHTESIIELLTEFELEIGETLIISKKIASKNIIRINGEIVSLKILKRFRNLLFHETSQNQAAMLVNPRFILNLININTNSKYLVLYKQYISLKEEIEHLVKKNLTKDERLEIIQLRLKELKKIEMFNNVTAYNDYYNEYEEHKIMLSKQKDNELILNCSNDVCNSISTLENNIKLITNTDIQAKVDQLSTIASEIDYYLNKNLNVNSNVDVEEYLTNINNVKLLMRKYNMNLDNIFEYHAKLQKEFDELSSVEIDLKIKEKQFLELKNALEIEAKQLSEKRQSVALKLLKNVHKVLDELDMKHVKMKFDFKLKDYSKDGFDEIKLLIATNNTEHFTQLADVASGGELSRILLALQSVVQTKNLNCLLFDEIDSGVSGTTAFLIGKLLKTIASNTQLILISHLPQVISQANNFIFVEKKILANNASTSFKLLQENEIIDKLSVLIAPTDSKNAKEIAKNMLTNKLKENE